MEPNSSSLARYPIAAVGLTTAAFICIRSARDAAFFSPSGVERLPPMFLLTQIGLALAATLHLGSMRRFGTRKTRTGAFSIVCLTFGASIPFMSRAYPGFMAVMFPLVPVLFAGLFSSAWLLAGDLLDGADHATIKRAYLRIGGAGLAGGITGGVMARLVGDRAGSEGALAAGVVLLAFATLICHLGHRAHPILISAAEPSAAPPGPDIGIRRILDDPHARTIAIVAALGSASSMLIEFQFYATAAAQGTTGTNFFANWSLIASASAILLQLALAPAIQSRFGISGALLVLPGAIFFGAGSLLVAATVLLPSLVRLSETALRASVHQTSWEQVFLVYDREQRGPMKVLLDGLVARVSGVAAALGLWALVVGVGAAELGNATWLGVGLLVTAGAWVTFTRQLRSGLVATSEPLDPMIRLPDS